MTNFVKIDIEDEIMIFSAKVGNETVEGIASFVVDSDRLILKQLHLQGSEANQVNRSNLWAIAKDIGRQYNVKEVVIQGGTRTTGKFKGKKPSELTIKID